MRRQPVASVMYEALRRLEVAVQDECKGSICSGVFPSHAISHALSSSSR